MVFTWLDLYLWMSTVFHCTFSYNFCLDKCFQFLSGQKSLFCDLETIEQRRPQRSGFAGGSRGLFVSCSVNRKTHLLATWEFSGTGARNHTWITITTEAQMTIRNFFRISNTYVGKSTCNLNSNVCKSVYPFILATTLLCLTLLVKNTFIWTSCSVINRDGAFHKFNQSKWCFHPWICMVGLPSSTELDLDEYGQKHRSENRGMDRNNHWSYLKY